MNYIMKRDIKTEKQEIINLLSGVRYMTKSVGDRLRERGYTFAVIGYSPHYAIKSREVRVIKVRAGKYLEAGEYLVVGKSSGRWGSQIYQGYLKKIV